jgi:2-dehydro-3-deoxy-D-arabinonate dehydratase
MKLLQFFVPGKGKRVGLVQGDRVLDITSSEEGVRSTLDLVIQGKTVQGLATRAMWLAKRLHRKGLDWRELQRSPSRRVPHLLPPIDAPETWGVKDGSAADIGRAHPALASVDQRPRSAGVLSADDRRPAFFFKATAHRIVGPHAPIVIRSGSHLSVPEASLAAVLGAAGVSVAFTACNDVTARDIERSGPDHLAQAKIYLGSCAVGPCLVTRDEIPDARALQVRCSVLRGGEAIFSEAATTPRIQPPIEDLVGWLCQDDAVPVGAMLAVGAGIAVPDGMALSDGDQVDIEVEGIGRLSNPARRAR